MSNQILAHASWPLIMGILNVTPDSFSDGGNFQDTEDAVMHALNMVNEGADIIDIGGESTRPGSDRTSAAEQIKRVLPVISGLRKQLPQHIIISIDTTLAEVAEAAVAEGAGMINDVSAGRDDPDLIKVAAQCHCPYVIMHMQGTPKTMQVNPTYKDVVQEIRDFLHHILISRIHLHGFGCPLHVHDDVRAVTLR